MIDAKDKPCFAEASRSCRDTLGADLVASSTASGWSSVLIEHHRITQPGRRIFETLPTPDQTIVVMLKGEQEIGVYRNGAWRPAVYRLGTIGMTPGNTVDRLWRQVRAGAPTEKLNLYIPASILEDAAEGLRKAGQHPPVAALTSLAFDDPLVTGTVRALADAMSKGATDLYAETAVHWLAVHLLSTHANWAGPQSRRSTETLTARRLNRVTRLMTERFAEPLSLATLAKEAGISRFHFARLFQNETGQSPHAFLTSLRMEEARRLLSGTDLQVGEIARQCGHNSPAHFAAAFTRRFGCSPSAMRRTLPRN